jgi:type II secretory ATPase GspE/PulE/Tfp pilus assembly ATPase PilB-like protein/EAL domain-containing protein (putative c-di-GMP-specific phosphodiesterase class I)
MGFNEVIAIERNPTKITKIKDKILFNKQYELIKQETLGAEEFDVFTEFVFFPIKDKNTGSITVFSTNAQLVKNLSKDSYAYKIFLKFFNTEIGLILVDEDMYFSLADFFEQETKVYTDEEAEDYFMDLLIDASRKKASDIHISWGESSVRVRYRIDGESVEQKDKYMSKEMGKFVKNVLINVTGESEFEKNEVAGHFSKVIDHKEQEYRLSICPTAQGGAIVLRAESQIDTNTRLDDWGYSPRAIELIRMFMEEKNGIVLVTGETGSGKSTLLYTIANESNKLHNFVVKTVEDPVEIKLDGIDQVQVNMKGDIDTQMTFNKAIKIFLRQDPNVIIVGEIRDFDVLKSATQAAKTGHLCFSTLHTNDVRATFTRIEDIGGEKTDIEDGVVGVVSQELIQTLCSSCKRKVEEMGTVFYERNPDGCLNCISSKVPGYKGRRPIVEIAHMKHGKDNFLPENFKDYYSKEDNIIYLLENGVVDRETADAYLKNEENGINTLSNATKEIWDDVIKKGVNSDFIFPYYQAMFDSEFNIIGYESLIRMKNESGEIISPINFINEAKKHKKFNTFSIIFLEKINRDISTSEKIVYINLDNYNTDNEDFIDTFFNSIDKYGIANQIKVDLSYDGSDNQISFIRKCENKGIEVCLDNFNMNLDSLNKIKNIKNSITKVKFSKKVTEFILENKMIGMYKKILDEYNLEIILNFIEKDDIIDELKDVGVNYFQGFGLHKPSSELKV